MLRNRRNILICATGAEVSWPTEFMESYTTPLPDGPYFPIHKITEPAALTRSIAVNIL